MLTSGQASDDYRRLLDQLWDWLGRFRWVEIDQGLHALEPMQSAELELFRTWRDALRGWDFTAFLACADGFYHRVVAFRPTGRRPPVFADLWASALTMEGITGRLPCLSPYDRALGLSKELWR